MYMPHTVHRCAMPYGAKYDHLLISSSLFRPFWILLIIHVIASFPDVLLHAIIKPHVHIRQGQALHGMTALFAETFGNYYHH